MEKMCNNAAPQRHGCVVPGADPALTLLPPLPAAAHQQQDASQSGTHAHEPMNSYCFKESI